VNLVEVFHGVQRANSFRFLGETNHLVTMMIHGNSAARAKHFVNG